MIGDQGNLNPAEVIRVLICSGRVYYDLAAERAKRGDRQTAIVRLEQYYPFHEDLKALVEQYPNAELVWVQDEPENQGVWTFFYMNKDRFIGQRPIRVVSRPAMAAPSTGLAQIHKQQAAKLMEDAFRR